MHDLEQVLAKAEPHAIKRQIFRSDLMKRRFTIVFLALFASLAAGVSAAEAPYVLDPAKLRLASVNAVIVDASANRSVYAKGADDVTPIASLTKLMTAMVTLDADLSMDETIAIDVDDLDYLKGTTSRLRMGAELPRREMLRLALMSSENRAASSLARTYPGGTPAFVAAMNAKAAGLGMAHTRYADPTGLSAHNVSTANDLAVLVAAAAEYPQIREFSTTGSHFVEVQPTGKVLGFNNTNNLVKNAQWDIKLSKTGYIREAGKCLVMLATIASKPFVIVLLDSAGKYTRLGDAQRVRHWLETGETLPVAAATKPVPKATKTAKAKSVSYARPAAKSAVKSRA
jgi:serine-type D-Ala-D-Ala endopeptidase (penicillin-binding protein 7)